LALSWRSGTAFLLLYCINEVCESLQPLEDKNKIQIRGHATGRGCSSGEQMNIGVQTTGGEKTAKQKTKEVGGLQLHKAGWHKLQAYTSGKCIYN
jgi:hypothetical protein